jgi:Tol biopolymer transport system component/tRNA A-37 threonylcarbamoyl transferase component Bud32
MKEAKGKRLGKYQILEEIAAGGMATVYKAYDTRLERVVALKTPLPQYARDKVFVQRFLREARTAAGFDHPNIITIFDVEKHAKTPYFTMQYVERTLRDLLEERGPLSLAEALSIVSQIASALDYANQRGYVHRDVKPTNILVTQKGEVILTDFGIAKAADGTKLTRTGELVGSPRYMSPEQIKGSDVDYRSDIYSLGIVCYEMLGGKPPFAGPTAAVLHSHVYDPPEPLQTQDPNVPVAVARAVHKALAKKRTDRYSSAGEMASALASAATGKRVSGPVVTPRDLKHTPAPQPPSGTRRRGVLLLVLGALLVGAALVLCAVVPSILDGDDQHEATPTWSPSPESKLVVPTETPTATSTRPPATPTITPSATTVPSPTPVPERIAFSSQRDGNWEIYVMNTDGSGVTQLTQHYAWDASPSWSPDATRIVFQSERDGNWEIYVINADGSGLQRLTNTAADERWPCWSPNGQRIAFITSRDGDWEIFTMNVNGGQQTRLTANSKGDMSPSWSPDGSRIAFASNRDGNWEIYTMNADGSGQTRLTYNASRDASPSWSPEGSRIAFTSYRDGSPEIYIMNANGSAQSNLTRSPANDIGACWSPDGQRIAFESNREGNFEIYTIGADGGGLIRLTSTSADDQSPAWSPR